MKEFQNRTGRMSYFAVRSNNDQKIEKESVCFNR